MSTKFLGVHIMEDLVWITNTSSQAKTAQQHLHFLQCLKKANILTTFYNGTRERFLTSCIPVWFGNCNIPNYKILQRIMQTAECIISTHLPPVRDIFHLRNICKASSIVILLPMSLTIFVPLCHPIKGSAASAKGLPIWVKASISRSLRLLNIVLHFIYALSALYTASYCILQ